MNSFTFHIPTEIVFGKDSEALTAALTEGEQKVLDELSDFDFDDI